MCDNDEYAWECPICKYWCGGILGISYTYPLTYMHIREEAKQGKFGKELQEILEIFPNAVIDPESYMFQCQECGEYECRPLLTSFIPDEEKMKREGRKERRKEKKRNKNKGNKEILPWEGKRIWSVSCPVKTYFASPREMREFYKLFEEYDHRCTKCGGKMEHLSNDWRYLREAVLICPHCKKPMEQVPFTIFDC